MPQTQFPVRGGGIEVFLPGEALNLREVGNCIEGDEVVQHQVAPGYRTGRVGLIIRHGEVKPLPQQLLHLLQP